MTDERYIYQQDIKEKKQAGRGAFHKKSGAKSKKCNFPSDYLTRKEKEKLNGECKTWSMNKFYSWSEFKEMPDDIQLRYINFLIGKYDVGLGVIGSDIFKLSSAVLYKYLKRKDLMQYVNKAPTGQAASKGRKKLQDAMDENLQQALDAAQAVDAKEAEEKPVDPIEAHNNAMARKMYGTEEQKQAPIEFSYFGEQPIGLGEEVGVATTAAKMEDVDPKSGVSLLDLFHFADSKNEPEEDDLLVSDFLVRMNKIDDSIIELLHRLYDDKEFEITISVTAKE